MQLRVKLFALARQLAGSDSVVVSVAAPATVRDVRRELGESCPALRGLLPRMMFAVDSEFADESRPVTEASELACIPPVSGGQGER